ncbi:MAG: cation transporter [Taibaiella sp.]|nr:cation transporter [Taibaiella sp.]
MVIRIQRLILILSIVLFAGKLLAWWLTHSVTILTDALEGIVNMVAGILGLYSVTLAARPRDTNHPYGHGKAEFITAAVEGTLIMVAGLVIIYEGIMHLLHPGALKNLNLGLYIVAVAGLLNYIAGLYAIKKGKENHSIVLQGAGSHLVTDAYSTAAILIGLTILVLTNNKWPWLDSAVALIFAAITLITGYKILRRSLAGMMDEMDLKTLEKVIEVVQKNRKNQWVDLHNLRVIQYGSLMHVDAHLTLPWYLQVSDADKEIHDLEQLIRASFNNEVELFIHIDGCMPYQCKLCAMPHCPERKEPLQAQLEWNIENIWTDAKHGKG